MCGPRCPRARSLPPFSFCCGLSRSRRCACARVCRGVVMICANDDARLTCRRRRSSAAPNGAITKILEPNAYAGNVPSPLSVCVPSLVPSREDVHAPSRSPLEARPWTPASSGTVPSHLEAETPGSLRSCRPQRVRSSRAGRACIRPSARFPCSLVLVARGTSVILFYPVESGGVWVRTEGGGARASSV